MKVFKPLKILLVLLLSAGLLLLSVACSSETLAVPAGFTIDEDYTLSWFGLSDARSYAVEITPSSGGEAEIRTTRRTSLELAGLPEGDYELRVRAVGGRNNDIFSEWSAPLSFHREHESGILYEYSNNNTEYTVAGAGTATGDLVIDDFYRGKPVTSIKLGAFRGNAEVESIVVGARVTSIENRAFYNCISLRSVTLPDSVTSIGYSAFQSCRNLTEVTIPAHITKLETLTFGYCTGLSVVHFNDSLEVIGDQAFYGCTALEEVTLPDSVQTVGPSAFGADTALNKVVFGTGIRTLEESAFRSSALRVAEFPELENELTLGDYCFAETAFETAEIPQGTVKIGIGAFYKTETLASVTIPETVTQVSASAFAETALYNSQSEGGDGLIYADEWLIGVTDDTWENIVPLGDAENPTSPPVLFREHTFGIADRAFLRRTTEGLYVGAPNLYSIDFPSGIHYIGEYAFAFCTQLVRVHALREDSLISTGSYSFAGCTSLSNVRFASGLQTIADHTFINCSLLDNNSNHPEYLTPDTVTRIGQNAFFGTKLYRQSSMRVVYAGNWLVGYDYHLRQEGVHMTPIDELPSNIVGVADYALGACDKVDSINLSNVRYIGQSAFTGCTELSSVVLDQNLTQIAPFAFYGCNNLRGVRFYENLRSIGRYAFYNTGLTEVDLSDTRVSSIGDFAFYNCVDLKTLTLPARSLKEIGKYSFFHCNSLTEVDLPDTLETLGERAFAECISLSRLSIGEGLSEIGDHAFRGCTALESISLPDSVKTVGEYAFMGCAFARRIDLGSVEEIGDNAFAGIEQVRDVVIPASVQRIGSSAFRGCTQLRSVTMLALPAYVGENAFYGDNLLTFYLSFGQDDVSDWSPAWNIGFRPAVWGCVFTEDGALDSVTAGEISNPYSYFGLSAPYREGYVFDGWSKVRGGEGEIGANELKSLPNGTTVYAVWTPL